MPSDFINNEGETLLALCRPGFENDLAAEFSFHAGERMVAGYPQASSGSGYVLWHSQQGSLVPVLSQGLIFARTQFLVSAGFEDLSDDRIGELWPLFEALAPFSELYLEYPDTNEGRELQRFLRGFRKALEPRLRKAGLLRKKAGQRLHLFFSDSRNGWLGSSDADLPLVEAGVLRLKLPAEAPSRSALKVEEALIRFFGSADVLAAKTAVDLGAAPGGWTWQLARRGIRVQAVDHGKLAPRLLNEFPVEHIPGDAFTWRPRSGVDLVVCDVVDKPARTLQLMEKWLVQGWAQAALFNLKLPMKRRFHEAQTLLERLATGLGRHGDPVIRAAQLYYDREEITVWASFAETD
ncbi:putative 23S rRNA C2498 ribose 2'-O-ribose methyltransferase [Alcanivorax hongdengensis A-11-3]|uniref:Putative 23S rRNA C2498 ribose 2'-O-ribose methyltransferase n=1 Tax=Alcanivorax hongdengensis A-11-3 TaxID=1177179 RepID=L0WDC6_9GAMM|nr:23S rRNA (cytidine(2498)-2'-O)-methyltransferase RlmM [Alcanivorax hongdengensis]EKF74991.1 putative 23S rRNA C2498 ribose 2'-O-ribose methyltransferase [Alcanivorax hongdengensis A-11-3]